mmetsp:Transcript_458/g.1381  ORF Transcript_458/g.1381 Transcript_458/m.1381 type:complete len:81 (-) Transcript_458:1319-1561(-)
MATRTLPVWDIHLTKQEAVEDTPSRKDGMLKQIEANYRKGYVQLITNVCARFRTYGAWNAALRYSFPLAPSQHLSFPSPL